MDQLNQLSLENYKAFYRRADIFIRPLTLFFGYNSAGKSAALRFLRLLADSTLGSGSSPFNLRSEVLKGADFSSLVSKHSSSQRIATRLDFGGTSMTFSILNLPDLRRQVIERLEIETLESSSPSVFEWLPKDDNVQTMSQLYAFTDASRVAELELEFDGLIPTGYPDELRHLLEPLAKSLEDFGARFVNLSTDCIIPGRYEVETAPAKKVTARGDGMMSMLQAAPPEVIQDISKWFFDATGYSFQRNPVVIGAQNGHRFTLHPNANQNIDVDIVDTGEGMGQVLPVVGLMILAKFGKLGRNPVISLEHPDLHIHPDAHVHLANLFCEAALSEATPRILVETHSENLLLGVQLAIAEKRIKPLDVAVHWVRGTDDGAIVEHIEFDEKARPVNNDWPIDVFRANSKLARDLYDKRKALKS